MVRAIVPRLGFGLAGDSIYRLLQERLGVGGYEIIPSDYLGAHSIGVYINDASLIPELVELMDRVEAERGGRATPPGSAAQFEVNPR